MIVHRRWQLALAMTGSAAFATPLARRQRNQRCDFEQRQRNQDLQSWEQEGGRLGTSLAAHFDPNRQIMR